MAFPSTRKSSRRPAENQGRAFSTAALVAWLRQAGLWPAWRRAGSIRWSPSSHQAQGPQCLVLAFLKGVEGRGTQTLHPALRRGLALRRHGPCRKPTVFSPFTLARDFDLDQWAVGGSGSGPVASGGLYFSLTRMARGVRPRPLSGAEGWASREGPLVS